MPEDDPGAAARVAAVMASPSYRQADTDPDFLGQLGMRGMRLQVDYAKAESILRAYGIERTVIVFGSTRIPDPLVARRRLDGLLQQLARCPGDARLERQIEIARAFDVDFLVEEGVIEAEDRELFWFAESAQEAWEGILQWHRNAGRPLVGAAGR